MTPFPDAVESSPVPPNNDNVSLSRSIAMSLEPSETSKSCAVMFASTYALIDCCDATLVAELLAKLSSSKNALPDKAVFSTGLFKTGLVSVLLVNVAVVPEKYVSSLVMAICFIVPLSFTMNWSASTKTTELALVSPSKTLSSVPVDVIATEPFSFGDVSVLLVSVCVPVSVATVLSIAKVKLLPLKLEVKPVPPKSPRTSESKSIEPLLEPSETSKSSAVSCVST